MIIMDANNFAGEDLDPETYAAVTKFMEGLQEMRPTLATRCMCLALSLIYRFSSYDHVTKEEFLTGLTKSIRSAMDIELQCIDGKEEINHK